MRLAVSILSVRDNYETWVKNINESNAEYLHLDIMDSTFTPNSSFTIDEAKKIAKLNNKKLDVHIMSTDLENILPEYIKLKPDTISIHFEADKNIDKYLKLIKDNNIKVGLVINPNTSINRICGYLNDIDQVLVMSVIPGEGGQSYIESTTDKLKLLKEIQKDYNFEIEVDGGINNKTINKVKKYADKVVCGSYITNANNYQKEIETMLQK